MQTAKTWRLCYSLPIWAQTYNCLFNTCCRGFDWDGNCWWSSCHSDWRSCWIGCGTKQEATIASASWSDWNSCLLLYLYCLCSLVIPLNLIILSVLLLYWLLNLNNCCCNQVLLLWLFIKIKIELPGRFIFKTFCTCILGLEIGSHRYQVEFAIQKTSSGQ